MSATSISRFTFIPKQVCEHTHKPAPHACQFYIQCDMLGAVFLQVQTPEPCPLSFLLGGKKSPAPNMQALPHLLQCITIKDIQYSWHISAKPIVADDTSHVRVGLTLRLGAQLRLKMFFASARWYERLPGEPQGKLLPSARQLC